MSILLDASDVFRFATRIEGNGERFYRHAARIAADDNAKKIFAYLADEELKHKEIFEDLLAGTDEHEPFESYPGEYLAYLRSYIDTIIFADEVFDKEISQITGTSSALDFGIQRELDSILYYHEIKNIVSKSQHKLIDKIISEERKHFSQLSDLRRKI